MIYFIHNTYNRPKQVIKTCKIEKLYFPDSKHIVVYNNNLIFNENDIDFFYFGENQGHKLGCINSVYSSFKYLLENYDTKEDDIIIFSHDDVYLYNVDKFKKYLNMDHEFIGRKYIGKKHSNCDYYVMLESFLIKPNLIKKINLDLVKELPKDKRNSECPEMHFGDNVLTNTNNYKLIDIEENNYGENQLGYFHIEKIRGQGD